MERIAGQDHVNNRFSAGNPSQGQLATEVTPAWLNAIQEEMAQFIESRGITPEAGNWTQLTTALNDLVASRATVKNFLINGGFEVWQAGRDFNYVQLVPSVDFYVADQWVVTLGTAPGVHGAGAQRFTIGPGDLAGPAKYGLRIGPFTDIAGQTVIEQRVEGIERFDSENLVFSFWARVNTGAGFNLTASTIKNFGPGNGETVEDTSDPLAVTTTWQRFEVPLVTGVATGAPVSDGNYQAFRLLVPAGVAAALELALCQVEYGTLATDFELRPISLTRMLCYRYLETSYPPSIETPGSPILEGAARIIQASGGGVLADMNTRFRVAKRATPTMTWYPTGETDAPGNVTVGGSSSAVLATSGTSEQTTGAPEVSSPGGAAEVSGHWIARAQL